jgi:hypothetical protein
MRGRLIDLIWQSNPTLYAPPKYRRACRYEAYIPFPLTDLALTLDARTAGGVSDAESAIPDLNSAAQPAPPRAPMRRRGR